MKKVAITLGALTRTYYTTTIEVPDDADHETIRKAADEIYDSTDRGDFQEDLDYWERGKTTWKIHGENREVEG